MLRSTDNYAAWRLAIEDFPKGGLVHDQLVYLLRYAILAPSAHNTQPWLFSISGSSVKLFVDKGRALQQSDPEFRQTYESLGACLENLLISANFFGFSTAVSLLTEFDSKKQGVVMVSFTQTGEQPTAMVQNQFKKIVSRHSAKLDYVSAAFSLPLKNQLEQYAATVFPQLTTKILVDNAEIAACADAVARGTHQAFKWKEFCAELREWVRPNWSRAHDGMPCFTMGIPTLLSGIIPHLFGRIPLGAAQAKMVKKQVVGSSAVVVVFGSNVAESWLAAGRVYENMALTLLADGWVSSIMGAPVEIEVAAKELQTALKSEMRPILFFRIGKVLGDVPASPRRPVEQCLIVT